MAFAESAMVQGTFTVPAALPGVVTLNLGFLPTRFEAINTTRLATGNAAAAYIQRLTWNSNMLSTTQGMIEWVTNGATTLNVNTVATNGIQLVDGRTSPSFGPTITGTTITKANPAVCTAAAHGLQTGDIVRFSGLTNMKQLGGLSFVVTVTGANTFTINLNTNTANFTAETAFTIRKQLTAPMYSPTRRIATAMTAANPIVVTTSTNHGLTVGQQVRLLVPARFGMTQASNLQGVITAVTADTLTIGSIDSSAFTAFAWPSTTPIAGSYAEVIPVGSGPTPTTVGTVTYYQDLLDDQTINSSFQGITIGTGILQATAAFIVAASDVFTYTAWRGDV